MTTASTAMATTTPLCRSLLLRLRVPKRTVKSARPKATQKAADAWFSVVSVSGSAKALSDNVTDCSCSAIYGVTPMTAITVTTIASRFDLP